MAEPASYRYDAYVSYNEADADWVFDALLPRLREAGLEVAIDEESFRPGAPVVEEAQRVIQESRHILAILSPAYVQDNWDNFETLLTQHQDPGARFRRLIPLLLDDCNPPQRIQLLHWVDVRDPVRQEAQIQRVIESVQGRETLPELRPEKAFPTGWQRVWELRGIALTAIAALLTLAVVAYAGYSQLGATKMERPFNIAMAEIGVLQENGNMRDTDLEVDLDETIFASLQAENQRYEDGGQVLIWHDSLPIAQKRPSLGSVTGATAEARAEAAAELADKIQADVVIYGHLTDTAPSRLVLEFFVADRLGLESNLTIGRYQFGDPIPVFGSAEGVPDRDAQRDLAQAVTERARALYWLLLGIDEDLNGRHQAALERFQRATELERWGERGEGKENLYFFVGRQYSFLQEFDLAEAELKKALDTSENNFPRAHIALGGVYLGRVQDVPLQERLDDPNLKQSIDEYERGVAAAQAAEDPLLVEIAQMALASALRLRAQTEEALQDRETALASLDRSLSLADGAVDALSSTTYYRLIAQAFTYRGAARLQKAQILEMMGQTEESRTLYQGAADDFAQCVAQTDRVNDATLNDTIAPDCERLREIADGILTKMGD